MPDFASHLAFLASNDSAKEKSRETDRDEELEKWLSASFSDDPRDGTASWTLHSDVLKYFVGQKGSSEASLAAQLASDVSASIVLPTLKALLASPKSNDELGGELLDLFGFDRMDIIPEILSNRRQFLEELEAAVADVSSPAFRDLDMSNQAAKQRIEAQLHANAARPLFSDGPESVPEKLPHVYTSSSLTQNNILSHLGTKYLLPIGTQRTTYEEYEEVIVPPAKPVPPRSWERLKSVGELDPLAQGCFSAYTSLNRIQSIVYECAYTTNENMLVCAPTGAGKTDVAMLTILRVVSQHLRGQMAGSISAADILRDDFKIIYVAPMKALASEIVRKFSKRLAWLSIKVRELTGDMQLTKAEIAETQVIVTTPEKWDVVTRKPTGEGEMAAVRDRKQNFLEELLTRKQKVRLLIIDEVHLLNEDRGAVIETIVARTLRLVESSQSLIRIVGLSATLPNFIDVSDFLRVSRYHGLFYFDSSFRPVPLEQHFLGIKGKANSPESRKNLDRATYTKALELVQAGHQVMVFVHARKETVKAAMALKDTASLEGFLEDFSCQDHPLWDRYRREIGQSRNREMKELFDNGFGIHHAGMLRSDRNLMERLFLDKAIKVLCCTATLAWGVNLPAHAVLIKGTQVYDSAKGSFVDLSVLDVLQIFGRAGRPGLEDEGQGFILTTEEKLTHYLDSVTAQHAIESQFITGIVDSLNAEIGLGTVTNVSEAVQWLGYTYLFVRMRKNPFAYGLAHNDVSLDPSLSEKRQKLIVAAAKRLAEVGMIIFNQQTESLSITERGRIAARYYIKNTSIEIIGKDLKASMSEADVLGMLSTCSEFEQIQLRENEIPELQTFQENIIPCEVKGGLHSKQGKVNILLQAYISQAFVEDFALVSDTMYVAQNGGRILRAVLEIAISQRWASVATVLMGLSKAIEKRMWPFENPMKQFGLSQDLFYNLTRLADDYTPSELAQQTAVELGVLLKMNERHGSALLRAAKRFPSLQVQYKLRPIASDMLRIDLNLIRSFDWDKGIHGAGEPFWLWLEDREGVDILQMEHVYWHPDDDELRVSFHIPLRDPAISQSLRIRLVSDRWLGAENEVEVPLGHIVMPSEMLQHTTLLDVPLLPVDSVTANEVSQRSPFRQFNAMQTQSFWPILHMEANALLSAPAGCGKSMLGYLAMAERLGRAKTPSWTLCVEATPDMAKQAASTLKGLCAGSKIGVEADLTSSFKLPDDRQTIVICSPQACLRLAGSNWFVNGLETLRLVVLDSLHLLDDVYELSIAQMLPKLASLSARIVGLATSLGNPASLAQWLNVPPDGAMIFKPADRDYALTVTSQTFTIPYSAALIKAMTRPLHISLKSTSHDDGTIVFVPSRSACLTIASDLLTYCALDENRGGFLPRGFDPASLNSELELLVDRGWLEPIRNGIGCYHRRMHRLDRELTLRLYLEGIIRVLIVPRTLCWTIPVRGNVVALGTQYINVFQHSGSEKIEVKPYEVQEISQMQSKAARQGRSSRFWLFCPSEAQATYMRLLDDGLPLASRLHESETFRDWLKVQRSTPNSGIVSKQDAIDLLSNTFLSKDIRNNPNFYDLDPKLSRNELHSRIIDRLWPDDGRG